jgi:hypothetical protein
MSFQDKTRRKVTPLDTKTKLIGSTAQLRWQLPQTGILAGIYLECTGTLTGTLSALNALGKSSIIREVRGVSNTGGEIFRLTGPQYHWLVRTQNDLFIQDPVPSSDGRAAVAAATFDISMYIPIALNAHDDIGLFLLQDPRTIFTLTVDPEADANIATGLTVATLNVTPHLVFFTVPNAKEDQPKFDLLHTLIGETQVVAAAGDVEYKWPLGATYLQLLLGLGFGVSGSDGWSRAVTRAAQTDRIYEYTPNGLSLEYGAFHGVARLAGTIPIDLIGTDGFGVYGGTRDVIYSQLETDLKTVVTATGAGTLHAVRRQLFALG